MPYKGILALLMTLVVVKASFDPSIICSLLANDTRINDPRACNAWITCIEGVPYNGTCTGSLFYDRNTYSCVNASSITCISSNPCAPLDGVSGFAADPYDCSGYYYCSSDGVATHGACETGYNFNSSTQDCIKGYPCVLNMDPDSYCNILPDGVFIKDPDNCNGYQLCWKGQVLNRTCPAGYYYEALEAECNYDSDVECTAVSTTTVPPASEFCNQTGVFVSDKQSCNGFYDCRASKNSTSGIELQHGICSTGRFFSAANGGECVPRTNIVCDYNRCVGFAVDIIVLANETNDGCHGYTLCQDGVPIGNGTCPGDGYFDELTQCCTSEVVNFPACVLLTESTTQASANEST